MLYPKPKAGYCLIAHPFEEGFEESQQLIDRSMKAFQSSSMDVFFYHKPVTNIQQAREAAIVLKQNNVSVIIIMLATWSNDYNALAMVQELNLPTITWAIEGINKGSLCGCQQINSILYELGYHYHFVLGFPESSLVIKKIESISKVFALKSFLKTVRIGILGNRTYGMTEIAYDEIEIRRLFGVEIVPLSINQFLNQVNSTNMENYQDRWEEVIKNFNKINVSNEEGWKSIAFYNTIKNWMDDQLLTGIAIECYPDLMGQFCLAASILADEGKILGCEGDVNATLAQIIMSYLTDYPTHNTDLLHLYYEDNSILLSHCGNGSFKLANALSNIELNNVRLANSGLCVLFPAKSGEVTLLNLLGRKDNYRMCIIEGKSIQTDMVFAGNPLRVKLPIPIDHFLQTISNHGFGHHWIAGYGKAGNSLKLLADMFKIKHQSFLSE